MITSPEVPGNGSPVLPIIEAPPEAAEPAIVPADKKEAAFVMPPKVDVDGFTVHALSRARKGFVVSTGNEIVNAKKHIKAYKEAHPDWAKNPNEIEVQDANVIVVATAAASTDAAKTPEQIVKDEEDRLAAVEWEIMTQAVPDFAFHMTALAFICTRPAKTLAALVGKSRDYFTTLVMEWADTLKDDEWDALTVRAFHELIESNIGADYKIKEDKSGTPGAPKDPNL